MEIIRELLPYHDRLPKRKVESLDLIVIHCTEVPTLKLAREFGEKILYTESSTGNSGHYYIDRDGSVRQYVDLDRVARHVIGHNETSIGIELVNTGRFPEWFSSKSQIPTEEYPAPQIASLKELLRHLRREFPGILRIARHSDLDTQKIPAEDNPTVLIRRKIDPGPLFPWEELLAWWQTL